MLNISTGYSFTSYRQYGVKLRPKQWVFFTLLKIVGTFILAISRFFTFEANWSIISSFVWNTYRKNDHTHKGRQWKPFFISIDVQLQPNHGCYLPMQTMLLFSDLFIVWSDVYVIRYVHNNFLPYSSFTSLGDFCFNLRIYLRQTVY